MQTKTATIKDLNNFVKNWRQQLTLGLELGRVAKKTFSNKKHVVIAGMGGSIIAAEIVKDLLAQSTTQAPSIEVWANYSLPRRIPKNSLVICSSYSGNTQETLSAFKQARAQRLPLLVITKDGKLKQLAENNRLPLILVPESFAPRFALFYFLGILLQIFASQKLKSWGRTFKLDFSDLKRRAQQLTRRIGSKNVLLYATPSFQALAHFWEIALDESAKTPSFVNLIPESEHHDPASFSSKNSVSRRTGWLPLFLNNPQDSSNLRRALALSLQTFRTELGMSPALLEARGANPLQQVVSHALLAQLTGLRLAQQKGINPLENVVQEGLKKKLVKKSRRK